jgi:hypothetical protein
MRFIALLCIGCAAAAPAAAQGGEPAQTSRPMGRWDREVSQLLRRAGQALEQQGYRLRPEPIVGSLNQGETEELSVGFRDGVAYALVGVCDSACGNLDLRLFDETSHEIAVAIGPGMPVLRLTPSRNAKYRLRVVMTGCSHSPCRYSVGVFDR